ncbi:hypothetical protein F2Q68_00005909 [Brassica cretica]|uniref:Uncharacterized protein n=1 Tax=Brassica cretica TaxID=69181 RepID=A0A8S9JKB7_BRACR|nr:hypothetical protein F2Q68_00005909 [Brassica cretica]
MEKEHGYLLKALGTQVAEPLRAMVMGAPLVGARHLAQRYERMRQEAESQNGYPHLDRVQTLKPKRESLSLSLSLFIWKICFSLNVHRLSKYQNDKLPELVKKLESAEAKLQDLKSNMTILSKEAVSAMTAVEDQQQNQTLQRLIKLYR